MLRRSVPLTVNGITAAVQSQPTMPVIDGEVVYEGIMDGWNPPSVQCVAFWTCILNGAAGHTYGAEGIWQFNSTHEDYGFSPVGFLKDETPWQVAYKFPGSKQLGIGKKFLQRYEWWRLEPHSEWVVPHWHKGDYELPYAAGIPGELRITFLPWQVSIIHPPKIVNLDPGVPYRAFSFCPRNAAERTIGDVTPDADNSWTIPMQPTSEQWLVVLEKKA